MKELYETQERSYETIKKKFDERITRNAEKELR